ncbi:glycosyl transferase family 90-domain-containing protein [Hyaloraphidium curvatum]|nr:glycosyl transferase family 90-domain-containing protein [Hyaloraphidium curvatum]
MRHGAPGPPSGRRDHLLTILWLLVPALLFSLGVFACWEPPPDPCVPQPIWRRSSPRKRTRQHSACKDLPYLGQIERDLAPYPKFADISFEALNASVPDMPGMARFVVAGLDILEVPNPHHSGPCPRCAGVLRFLAVVLGWYAANVSPRGLRADLLFYLHDAPVLDPDTLAVKRYWEDGWSPPPQAGSRVPYIMFCSWPGTGAIHFPFFDTYLDWDRRVRSIRKAGARVRFRDKRPVLFWRGSNTGPYALVGPTDPPRSRLVALCSSSSAARDRCDAGFTALHDVGSALAAEMNRTFGTRPFIPLPDAAKSFAYLAVLDGNAWPDRLSSVLAAGAVPFKQRSPYTEFFSSGLKEWEHFVPLRSDVADALERVDWARAHPDEAERIAENARGFVDAHLREESVHCYVAALLEAYSERQGGDGVPPGALLRAASCPLPGPGMVCLAGWAGPAAAVWGAVYWFWSRTRGS